MSVVASLSGAIIGFVIGYWITRKLSDVKSTAMAESARKLESDLAIAQRESAEFRTKYEEVAIELAKASERDNQLVRLLEQQTETEVRLRDTQTMLTTAKEESAQHASAAEERKIALEKCESELSKQRTQNESLQEQLSSLTAQYSADRSEWSEREKSLEEKLELLRDAGDQLKKEFAAISEQALKNMRLEHDHRSKDELEERRKGIELMIKPLDERLQELNKATTELRTEFSERVKTFADAFQEQKEETAKLTSIFRSNQSRGRWGEWQLRQVLERAGLTEGIHYKWQPSSGDETQRRPEAIIYQPDGSYIPIDVKTPFAEFEDLQNSESENQKAELGKKYASLLKKTISDLSKRDYDKTHSNIGWVILYLPVDSMFSTAVHYDQGILEHASDRQVFLATPMLLLYILQNIGILWRHQSLTENAEEIRKLGGELYDRIIKFGSHFSGIGKSLGQAVEKYNDAAGSMERMLLPQTRKFKELGVTGTKEVDSPAQVVSHPRPLVSQEFSTALPPLEDVE